MFVGELPQLTDTESKIVLLLIHHVLITVFRNIHGFSSSIRSSSRPLPMIAKVRLAPPSPLPSRQQEWIYIKERKEQRSVSGGKSSFRAKSHQVNAPLTLFDLMMKILYHALIQRRRVTCGSWGLECRYVSILSCSTIATARGDTATTAETVEAGGTQLTYALYLPIILNVSKKLYGFFVDFPS